MQSDITGAYWGVEDGVVALSHCYDVPEVLAAKRKQLPVPPNPTDIEGVIRHPPGAKIAPEPPDVKLGKVIANVEQVRAFRTLVEFLADRKLAAAGRVDTAEEEGLA